MKKAEKKQSEQVKKMFKVYNGSAYIYDSPQASNKSIAKICSGGTAVAKGTSIGELFTKFKV